jgi:hypothetical protein
MTRSVAGRVRAWPQRQIACWADCTQTRSAAGCVRWWPPSPAVRGCSTSSTALGSPPRGGRRRAAGEGGRRRPAGRGGRRRPAGEGGRRRPAGECGRRRPAGTGGQRRQAGEGARRKRAGKRGPAQATSRRAAGPLIACAALHSESARTPARPGAAPFHRLRRSRGPARLEPCERAEVGGGDVSSRLIPLPCLSEQQSALTAAAAASLPSPGSRLAPDPGRDERPPRWAGPGRPRPAWPAAQTSR